MGVLVSALILVVVTSAFPIGAAAASSANGPIPPTLSLGGALSSATFAARAGYSANRASVVTGATPATGSPLIVVTFQARDPSRFFAPAAGSRPLSMNEIADRFGLTPQQYSGVERYFLGEGLTIVHTWPDRLSLTLEGPVASVDRAFGTTLMEGAYGGRAVSFPSTPPSLPAAVEGLVESVTGLESGFDHVQLPALNPAILGANGVAPSLPSTNIITPAIARGIYDFSELYNRTGSPQYASSEGIAVLLWGPGYVPNDLSTFFSRYYPSGFPAPQIVPEPVDGAPPPSASAAQDPCPTAEELTLDLEWAGSMAPGAHLYAVYAPPGTGSGCSASTSAMTDALQTAIGLPITTLSMSFGTAESSDTSLFATWNTLLATAAQRGITVLAATGDGGGAASSGCSGGASVQYPSSSPNVIAVGGTAVTLSETALGQITGFTEAAWSGSGGGFSTQFAAPPWQHLGNSARGEPDVSATARDNFLYFNGQSQYADGTSFATPLWAGLVSEMGAQYGRSMVPLAPRLYAIGEREPSGTIGQGLVDITSGSTCLGTAGPGWDEETGWGTPRAVVLYEELTSTFVALSLSVTPSTTGPGGSVTISARLANATSGAPIPGIPVALSLTSSTSLGPCTGSFGAASPVTGPSGNVSATMSVPSCYLGSSARVGATVQSNGLYGVNSTDVRVNLLSFLPFLSGITTFPYNVIGFAAIFLVAIGIGYFLGRPRRRMRASLDPGRADVGGAASAAGPTGPGTGAGALSVPGTVTRPASETTAEAPKTT